MGIRFRWNAETEVTTIVAFYKQLTNATLISL